ncbi:MAG: DUF6286 domain-containing protein [Actinomycetota bacterium]
MLSLLLGLVLLAGGLLVMVEAVLAAAGQSTWLVPGDSWYESLTTTELGDDVVRVTALGVGVLGLIILVVEARRWRPVRLPVHVDGADGHWWVSRRSAERRLERAAEQLGGVGSARASLRARRGPWRGNVRVEAREGSREAVEQEVTEMLGRLGAPPESSVQVRVAKPRRVS